MKKLLFICLLFISNIVLSQRFISGWKVGPNLSKLLIMDDDGIFKYETIADCESQFGVDMGIFKTIPLNGKWSINTDAIYQLRRSKIINHKLYFSYLNVNPSIQYQVSKEFTLLSGFNVGILLNALEVFDKFLDDPGGPLGIETVTRNRNKYYKTLDLQWATGVEVKFSQSFGTELKGAVSLFDLNSKYNESPGVNYTVFKYWSISLSAKYYFK